jgi:hypothetical protein
MTLSPKWTLAQFYNTLYNFLKKILSWKCKLDVNDIMSSRVKQEQFMVTLHQRNMQSRQMQYCG